ncbi:hypothetical protein CLAIMM_00520 [Cladophialophora immunda]|nr:hypothetical protein CLAIMM_00520 [Cladophialophora immunda]
MEEETLNYGYMDLSLYHLGPTTTSIPYVTEAGAATIYETGSSGSCATSPAEGDMKMSKPRRRKARMTEVDAETQSRRRAQNRESQQAYRHRREDYIHSLRSQIVDLHLRHRDLWQSYYSQDRRLSLLREVAADLTMEVTVLRRGQSQSQPRHHQQSTPDQPVCLGDKGDGTPISPDLIYPGSGSTYVESSGTVFSPRSEGWEEWLPRSEPTYSVSHRFEDIDLP